MGSKTSVLVGDRPRVEGYRGSVVWVYTWPSGERAVDVMAFVRSWVGAKAARILGSTSAALEQ